MKYFARSEGQRRNLSTWPESYALEVGGIRGGAPMMALTSDQVNGWVVSGHEEEGIGASICSSVICSWSMSFWIKSWAGILMDVMTMPRLGATDVRASYPVGKSRGV